jgi:acetoin utilization deacetylase AcuC-like enzyme/ankyrin repeat protein
MKRANQKANQPTVSEGNFSRDSFPLHDAAESGDIVLMRRLFDGNPKPETAEKTEKPEKDKKEGFDSDDSAEDFADEEVADSKREFDDSDDEGGDFDDFDPAAAEFSLNSQDEEGLTPLQLAVLNRQLECMQILVEKGANIEPESSFGNACEGCPLLHLVLQVGKILAHERFCVGALKFLVEKGSNINAKDERGRTPLHLAASCTLTYTKVVLELGGDSSVSLRDRRGHHPMHYALCSSDSEQITSLLLEKGANLNGVCGYGKTVLHYAASCGHTVVAMKLVSAGADVNIEDKRGLKAVDYARKSGHEHMSTVLTQSSASIKVGTDTMPVKTPPKTVVFTHPFCEQHHTCSSIKRGLPEPPPENVNRLAVIYQPGDGVLRGCEFADLEWDQNPPLAQMGDILRVHEFAYINRIQQTCAKLEAEDPNGHVMGYLDADTAISRSSFEAARYASGSVCTAVDRVLAGKNRNAFCAVRPPGHHAGPRGLVSNENDGEGSHGFCLVNNVAIGAAYALSVHRHNGVKKVAIVDFDVHHGNGTEAIVENLVPITLKTEIKTPFCTGSLNSTSYAPWLGEDDAKHVLFVSVHGYGKKVRCLMRSMHDVLSDQIVSPTCRTLTIRTYHKHRGSILGQVRPAVPESAVEMKTRKRSCWVRRRLRRRPKQVATIWRSKTRREGRRKRSSMLNTTASQRTNQKVASHKS